MSYYDIMKAAHTGNFTGLTMRERLMAMNLRKQIKADAVERRDESQKDDDEPKMTVRSPPT